ncbi:MAG: bifunctional UDP-N-acetylglucosamine diphosphorylase/glucosamine-1-phosphate N-acetyltransferase GlmU [Thermoanaerobaculia bacterium]|nr:bifunctional UDP-N-acetylglucosamine diphosphorylase/glucosamine-1-phosphate N-acetyltransferase GlmU [Thermoanaerobaculia bacterium]
MPKQGSSNPQTVAVVLAAGQGTRMRSSRPKPLHAVGGRPMLSWVLDAAGDAGCTSIFVVVGHRADEVRQVVEAMRDEGDPPVAFVEQLEQLGTGHALAQAESHVDPKATILVLSGDVPLVRPATLRRLADAAAEGWGAMATATLEEPGSLGRVLARGDDADRLERIVEARDASPAELAVHRINAGLYALPAGVFDDLRRVGTANAQGEIYLTDALGLAAADGRTIALVELEDPSEALGVNDRHDQTRVHQRLVRRHLDQLMADGVTILDPDRTTVEPTARVGTDTILHPGVSLLGHTTVGSGCILHQGAWLRDVRLADDVEILPYSVLESCEVRSDVAVGPFGRVRPASVLLEGSRVGNFVELKKTILGRGAKASHLTYLGDSEVGDGANIGAGTITCNYDGKNKNRTEIGAGAFIGSDTMLIAPVRVGERATTGAGSTITQDVPDDALAVGRARQRIIPDWTERKARGEKDG